MLPVRLFKVKGAMCSIFQPSTVMLKLVVIDLITINNWKHLLHTVVSLVQCLIFAINHIAAKKMFLPVPPSPPLAPSVFFFYFSEEKNCRFPAMTYSFDHMLL